MEISNSKFKNIFSLCILGITFGLTLYFVLWLSRGSFNSDWADSLYWAKAAYDAKSFFNPDFIYACTLPFGGQWFFLPFIGIFGVSMKTQLLGMSLFLLVFTLTLFFFFKIIRFSTNESCLSCAFILLILSSSAKLREIFWGHVLYYSCGVLGIQIGFLLFFYYTRKPIPENSRQKRIELIRLCIWMFLCASNGNSVMPLTVIPLFAGIIGEKLLRQEPLSLKQSSGFWCSVMILFLVSVVGYLWGTNLASAYPSEYADGYLIYSDISNWPDNFLRLFTSWLTLLGAAPAANDPIVSLSGFSVLLKICAGIFLAGIPVFMLISYSKIKSRAIRIYTLTHWTLTAVILFGWIFGELSNLTWRLSPLVYSSAVMTAFFFHWVLTEQRGLIMKRLACVSVLTVIATCLLIFSEVVSLPSNYLAVNPHFALAAFLKEKNLTYGYAEFWEAAALTVITDSDIQVRNILINDDFYSIHFYQTNINWYRDQENVEQYFIVVSSSLYEHMVSVEHFLIQTMDEIYQAENYIILVYNHNLFSV